MQNKIKKIKEIAKIVKRHQTKNKKVVLVHGCFDIFHNGHLDLLIKAKKLGDILIVGIDHDDNVKAAKGPKRPYNSHQARMFLMSHLIPVNYVFLIPPFDHSNSKGFFEKLYKEINPNILATGVGSVYDKKKKIDVEKMGFKFAVIKTPKTTSTKILKAFGLE